LAVRLGRVAVTYGVRNQF